MAVNLIRSIRGVALAAAFVLLVPAAAYAGFGDDSEATEAQDPAVNDVPGALHTELGRPAGQEGDGFDSTAAPKTGQAGGCTLVASANFLGMACARSRTGETRTVKEILGPDDVPTCWHEKLSEEELANLSYENTPGADGYTWYWERCLSGVRPNKTLEPGGIKISVRLVQIKNSDPKKHLTDRQQQLVEIFGPASTVPTPVAVPMPSETPYVGMDVAFVNGTSGEIEVPTPTVTLRARVKSLFLEPLGHGRPDGFTCSQGNGIKVSADDTRQTKPNACWYTYKRSSANMPQNRYPMAITAHWYVDYTTDGGQSWHYFHEFDKPAVSHMLVPEIQTLPIN